MEKERERRANVPTSNRRAVPSPGVLAPLPRRATPPPSGLSTELTEPGWGGESDATVRAMPERMQPAAAMARAAPERTQLSPSTGRFPPERERPHPAPLAPVRSSAERPPLERATTERSLVERAPAPTVDQALVHDKTEALVATIPEAGGSFGFLKAFVLTLALVTLGFAAWWMYTNWRNQALEKPFVPPKNAPIPGETGVYAPPAPGVPLYEQDIPAEKRNPKQAQQRRQAGYAAYKSGDLEAAATEYLAAFALEPSPELSLILGEVYWALDNHDEARAWWKRHLRDLPDSHARATLLLKEPLLASAAGSR